MPARVRVGTCSWADESLVKHWYPPSVRSSEQRLRHYAERFDTVELDASFYRLPEADTVAKWVERTPPQFVFHVKAFALMTRHPVKLEQLPPELRDAAAPDARGRVERPSRELRSEVFARFHSALAPFRDAGKLGGILLQFPSYVVSKPASFEYLEWAKEELRGDEMLVEFRHRSWLDDENRDRTLAFLEELGATHVIVDAPKTEARNLVPTVLALTSPTLYVRFHGRNASTWNVRGRSAAERFDYLYRDEELREWVGPMRELAEEARQAYAVFNNNGRSPAPPGLGERDWIAQAPVNAATFKELLQHDGVPVA
ncbi:MAG: DUF72 domain-containing protein [Actinomycetota bacterium]|nr:DUF72 domain-containing protein [Actinomycetota bacterium]